MTYKLFEEVILLENIPEKGLKKGDVPLSLKHLPFAGGENGITLKEFIPL